MIKGIDAYPPKSNRNMNRGRNSAKHEYAAVHSTARNIAGSIQLLLKTPNTLQDLRRIAAGDHEGLVPKPFHRLVRHMPCPVLGIHSLCEKFVLQLQYQIEQLLVREFGQDCGLQIVGELLGIARKLPLTGPTVLVAVHAALIGAMALGHASVLVLQ